MKKEKIILFDLDGTLIDSTYAIVSTFLHSFEKNEFNFSGTEQDIKNEIGYPLEIMFENLGVLKEEVGSFVEAYSSRYRKISRENTILLPNVIEALEEANNFARLSVVTTKRRAATIPLLEHLGINKYFEVVTGRECVINPKPNPEPISKTLTRMKYSSDKNKVWMVGDTKLDIISAKESGVNNVALLSGYGHEKELLKYTNNIKRNALDAVRFIKAF